MCPIKLIGFDLDDCLFDSTGLSERARIKGIDAMIDLGLKLDRQKAITLLQEIVNEYGSNSSKHYDYFIRRLNRIENFSISFNQQYKYIAAAVMAYHQEKIDSLVLYEDVKPSLKKIRDMGIKSAIISDGIPIKQYEKILRLQIDELIDLIVITDEVGIRKPNPKLFEYFLEKFGVKGNETIYVGDNLEKDIIPAKINGINTIYIHRGGKYDKALSNLKITNENKPDYEISQLYEIFDIVSKLNNKNLSDS
ncbi:MAG: TIGR02253 family HAD-type hydrolase [Promethearchaeota archaeon]|nr:MAG: TIGR02253 family HAD-type hydrolase [Candidatus Lokiarchaeota archaeon]